MKKEEYKINRKPFINNFTTLKVCNRCHKYFISSILANNVRCSVCDGTEFSEYSLVDMK